MFTRKLRYPLFILFAALGCVVCGLNAQAQSSKSAAMIRDIKAEFPEREKQIAEKCDGTKVTVDVDFASFNDDYDALLRVPSHGLKEMTYGVRRFCTDSNNTSQADPVKVGALRSKVKTIRLRNVAKPTDKKITLQGDVLIIEMHFKEPLAGGLSQVAIANMLGDIL